MYRLNSASQPSNAFCCFDLVIDCGALSTPTNGDQTTTGTLLDDTADFSCNAGYKLDGSDTRTCQSDCEWSGTATSCVRKLLFDIKLRSISAKAIPRGIAWAPHHMFCAG